MYYPNTIEEICYTEQHIEQVLGEIKVRFHDYFDTFIQSAGGTSLSEQQINVLAKRFESEGAVKTHKKNTAAVLKNLIAEGIEKFEKDRQAYIDLLDDEWLEEYEDNPAGFKAKLRSACPIIRVTLNSKAKELDKYRYEFGISNPNKLLTVCQNLSSFSNDYAEDWKEYDYDSINSRSELDIEELDTENYSVFGVIGGGIKSHFLYKLNPAYFPYRSKDAIWSLWYLTNKKTFECEEESQFLMINVDKSRTNQNYFYPYELFGFYAYNIYRLLKKEAEKNDVHVPDEHRYVLVDQFLSYIAKVHEEDIKFISSSSEDKQYLWM